MAEIHRGSTGGDLLRGNPRLSLTQVFGPGESGDQAAHVIDQVQDMLGESVRMLGAEPVRLNSGAGHDGQAMAKLCPIGMLFVRCRGGVSHNPMEYASPRDLGLAVAALIGFLARFDPRKLATTTGS